MFNPQQLYDLRRHYYYAYTIYNLHSTAVSEIAAVYFRDAAVSHHSLHKHIRRDAAAWAYWLKTCFELDQGYCLDFGRDGLILRVSQADRFYLPLVRWYLKPWRVGLFAPTFYRF